MIENFVIGILVMLLIGQQAYWSYVVFRLSDRLMSRSFLEFKQGNFKPAPFRPAVIEDDRDLAAEKQAQDLNAVMGLI